MPGPKVDLSDLTLLPPLINAHDHLELNHYPRTKFREVYASAHAWAEDVNARLNDEPFRSLRAAPLEDRLFIGGLKNLLCGALIVMQHDPAHKALFRRDYPVRVVRRYAWAHSLRLSTPANIQRTYRHARRWRLPFAIHIGEGIDAVAAQELARLDALLNGDLSRVVLVHGVGLRHQDVIAYAPRVRGLVICPTTNQYLLRAVPNARAWVEAGGRLALGSDSRLTASGDLLDELRTAHHLYGDLPYQPEAITGARADTEDLIVVRGNAPLHSARRADLALVMRGGVPLIGDPELMARFTRTDTMAATLDGQPKAIHSALARRIATCSLKEPGLELS
jgi:cytosine/adenosine deaminase-related metal-dependent hydrolase